MTRAAIYARYSDDNQNDRSVDDQIAMLREYAAKHQMEVVAVYEDRAISGASIKNRPGAQRLLTDAFAGARFDVVLAESMSRIGRDQEDRAYIRKRLSFCDVRLMTPADGNVTQLVDGVRAVVDSQYLEDLKVATRRGMAAVIADGRNSGGRAYGYRTIEGEPGNLEIVADEAVIVRRIFCDFIAGASSRAIAAQLNAEGVTPPRGRFWRASSILGSGRRGHGILRNPLYAGRIVWNRVRMVKHPDTGRRLSRVNPESEWRTAEAPQLTIVDADTFAKVQARLAERGGLRQSARMPRYMLSGLLRCGACGAGMSVRGVDRKGRRIYCAQFTEAKSCDNSRGYYLTEIERAVVAGFRERLGSRAAIAHFIRCYNEERQRAACESTRARARLERDLAEAQRTLDRMIDAHIRGRVTDSEAEERLPTLRAERDRIQSELNACEAPPKVVALHPAAIDEYLRTLDRLADVINDDLAAGDSTAAEGLRQLVHHVTVIPAPAGTKPTIAVSGHLETLLNLPAFTPGSLSRGALVAGGGLGRFPATDFPVFSFTRLAG